MRNTYINPLVLPDYPNLLVKHPRPEDQPMSGWGHDSKKMVTEFQILEEMLGKDNPHNKGPWGGQMPFHISYHNPPANDVRATADPSVLYHDGKWYLYCTCGMVYDSADFIHWNTHPDETWMRSSAIRARCCGTSRTEQSCWFGRLQLLFA